MSTVHTRIRLKRDTTENWNATRNFIPLKGEVIIYEDYKTLEKENGSETVTVNIPGIKIGNGNIYVQELPFIDDELRDKLMKHIEDQEVHLALGERNFWNSKVDIVDNADSSLDEIIDDTLVFTRDDWNNFKG